MRRLGWFLAGLGLAAALIVQLGTRAVAPPLYDGIIVTAPYVWLQPPPGLAGGATGVSAMVEVNAGVNAEVVVATDEEPPQAQVLAEQGALMLARDATLLRVGITPIEAPVPVQDGYVDGNVYRFDVVDQAGRPATAPASAYVSILLRAADPTDLDATIERFDGTKWTPADTENGGEGGYLSIVTQFGVFAVVGHGTSPYPTSAPSTAPVTPASTSTEPAPPSTIGVPTPAPSAAPSEPGESMGLPLTIVLVVAGAAIGALVVARLVRERQIRARQQVRQGWRRRR